MSRVLASFILGCMPIGFVLVVAWAVCAAGHELVMNALLSTVEDDIA